MHTLQSNQQSVNTCSKEWSEITAEFLLDMYHYRISCQMKDSNEFALKDWKIIENI